MTNDFSLPPVWSYRLAKERRVESRAPVLAGGRVHAVFYYERGGFTESRLGVFDAASGGEVWSHRLAHVGNEPVVAEGGIYWSGYDGAVHALDGEGRVRWQAPGTKANIGMPVVQGERVIVAEILGGATATWCLDRATGRTLWRTETGGHAYRVLAAGERVYHSAAAPTRMDEPPRGTFCCLSIRDGRMLWSAACQDTFFSPLVCGRQVLVCDSRELHVFDAASGKAGPTLRLEPKGATLHLSAGATAEQVIVRRDTHEQGGDSMRGVCLEEKRGFFGGLKTVPRLQWTLTEERGLCGPPVQLPSGRFVYLTHTGVLCLFDAGTGTRLAETSLGAASPAFGGIAVAEGRMAVAHGRSLHVFSTAML